MAVKDYARSRRRGTTTEHETTESFDLPAIIGVFSSILFDMDGTLIDSTDAIVKHWERYVATIYNFMVNRSHKANRVGKMYGLDPKIILATSHGRRSIDMFKEIDPANANWERKLFQNAYAKFWSSQILVIADLYVDVQNLEGQIPLLFGSSATEVPGARSFLSQVRAFQVPWAIVTSGTRPLVTGWLKILNIPFPPQLITAEDVENGKPDPACYLLGQKKLGMEGCRSDGTLVIEDAPAGIRAGKAAGFKVLGLATTHEAEELREAGADWVVGDLRSMIISRGNGGHSVKVEIRDTL